MPGLRAGASAHLPGRESRARADRRMAAPPLLQPQAPALTGRRSAGAKSRAFLASLAVAPDEAAQHQQQQGGAAAGIFRLLPDGAEINDARMPATSSSQVYRSLARLARHNMNLSHDGKLTEEVPG